MPSVNNPFAWMDQFQNHPLFRQGNATLPTLQTQKGFTPNAFTPRQPLAREVNRPLAGTFPIPNAPQTTVGPKTGLPPVPPTPGSTTPPTTPPTTTKPATTTSPTTAEDTKKEAANNGGVYRPIGTGYTSPSAYRPIRFPGVDASGVSWAKYQDGSFVDYSSTAWKRASSIQIADEQQKKLWDALPDSWKADIATWDPALRDAYLQALSKPGVGGVYQGKFMIGKEAAELIRDEAHKMRQQEYDAKNKQKAISASQMQKTAFQPRAYFVPR